MWKLLKHQGEWEAYRHELLGVSDAVWVQKPKAFPCLVDSVVIIDRVNSAFVYPADARRLLEAVDDGAGLAKTASDPTYRWVAAQLLTHAWFLVETGICTREQYEEKLLESLEMVDEAIRERHTPETLAGYLFSKHPKKP